MKYISLKSEEKDICCMGEMKDDGDADGCCKDEIVSVKIDDHHKQYAVDYLSLSKVFTPALVFQTIPFLHKRIYSAPDVLKISHSPPLLCSRLRLYVLNCVYLI